MRRFKAIQSEDARAIVRFCKMNEAAIDRLSGEEYFAIWSAYMQALYEMETWDYLATVTEEVITYAMLHNIKYYNGEDIYLKALYYKGLMHYHRHETNEAHHIAKALQRLNPKSRTYFAFRQKCLLRTRPRWVDVGYGIAIVGYFAAAFVALFKLLYIQPFALEYDTAVLRVQLGLFCLSAILIGASWWLHRRWASRQALIF